MTHRCPVKDCTAKVPQNYFMCARHWRMVPSQLQSEVYESFRKHGRLGEAHTNATMVVNRIERGRTAIAMPAGTKALTLYQPWASLVVIGAKPYEFRKWNFADKPHLEKLIGKRVVIHASVRPMKRGELEDIVDRIDCGESALVTKIAHPFLKGLLHGDTAPLAAAVGSAILGRPSKSAELFKHIVADSDRLDHQMYAWPMQEPQQFDAPVPALGSQGFWNWN